MQFFSELFFESLVETATSPGQSKFVRIACFLLVTVLFFVAIGSMVLLIAVIEERFWARIFYAFLAFAGSFFYCNILKRMLKK